MIHQLTFPGLQFYQTQDTLFVFGYVNFSSKRQKLNDLNHMHESYVVNPCPSFKLAQRDKWATSKTSKTRRLHFPLCEKPNQGDTSIYTMG